MEYRLHLFLCVVGERRTENDIRIGNVLAFDCHLDAIFACVIVVAVAYDSVPNSVLSGVLGLGNISCPAAVSELILETAAGRLALNQESVRESVIGKAV